jgi:RNA polymerase sigma-70 factor (ECF subfamily)
MRDLQKEVSPHQGALPQMTSVSLAEQVLGKLTAASHAAMRVELNLRVQKAINGMDPTTARCLSCGTSSS